MQVSGDLCCCLQHNLCHLSARAGPTVNQSLFAFLLVLCRLPGDAGALLGWRAAATRTTFYCKLRNLFRTHLLKSQVWRRRWLGGFCPPSSCAASHPEKAEIPYNEASLSSPPGSCAWHGDRDVSTAPAPLAGTGPPSMVKRAENTRRHRSRYLRRLRSAGQTPVPRGKGLTEWVMGTIRGAQGEKHKPPCAPSVGEEAKAAAAGGTLISESQLSTSQAPPDFWKPPL